MKKKAQEPRRTDRRCTSAILHACVTALTVAVLAGCGARSTANTGKPENAPHVPVVKVARGDLTDKLEIAGEFQPYQEINVYAKVSGYIRKLYVNWGTHVTQGQLLAVLEIPELQQQL